MDGPPDAAADSPLHLALPADPAGALAQVRDWTRGLLADLAEAVRIDAVLVVDEMLTYGYTRGGVPRTLRLLRRGERQTLRVELDLDGLPPDAGAGTPHHRGGLVMTELLGVRWGTAGHATGDTLWADVPLATIARHETTTPDPAMPWRLADRDDEAPTS